MTRAELSLFVLRRINDFRLALLLPDLPLETEAELREELVMWELRLHALSQERKPLPGAVRKWAEEVAARYASEQR